MGQTVTPIVFVNVGLGVVVLVGVKVSLGVLVRCRVLVIVGIFVCVDACVFVEIDELAKVIVGLSDRFPPQNKYLLLVKRITNAKTNISAPTRNNQTSFFFSYSVPDSDPSTGSAFVLFVESARRDLFDRCGSFNLYSPSTFSKSAFGIWKRGSPNLATLSLIAAIFSNLSTDNF